MRSGQRSRTAEGAAAMRALHQLFDSTPRVFEDPFAAPLLGFVPPPGLRRRIEQRARFERAFRRWFPLWLRRVPVGSRRLRAQLVVRSRYAEDRLAEALLSGIDQYVVLAAGLDSFGLRRPDLEGRLTIFEVDHPETQAWKRRRLETLPAPPPPHLELVPCDFERQSLAAALATSSFDRERPAFLSWLGTTYYLTRQAIGKTLDFVAGMAAGSELVLDYWSSAAEAWADAALLQAVRVGAAAQGEIMHSFFRPSEMQTLVEGRGLRWLEGLDPAEADRRYLDGRGDGLALPGFAHLAAVGV